MGSNTVVRRSLAPGLVLSARRGEVELSYEAALNGQPKTANEPVTVRQAIAMFTAKKAKRAKGTLTKYPPVKAFSRNPNSTASHLPQ